VDEILYHHHQMKNLLIHRYTYQSKAVMEEDLILMMPKGESMKYLDPILISIF
jgi:hypothetical protein